MNTVKRHAGHGLSQFELSKKVLNNLKHYKLTPTGKLVLIVLVDCYNPGNGSVVFPSIEFIADKAGVGLTATKQAIKDLINEGLIIKTKRDKVAGNKNKYLLTLKVQNSTYEQSENELFKKPETDRFMITNKKEQIIQQKEDEFLTKFVESKGVKNKVAYINAIKRNGGAGEIVNEMRQIEANNKAMQNMTKTFLEADKENREAAQAPTQYWRDIKAELLKHCK